MSASSAVAAVAKQTAARAAARAYARRCSWVDAEDLESEAWVGILQAPPFDPARAPVLSRKKQDALSEDDQLRTQMFGFYFRVGILWLSGYVTRQGSPVTRVRKGGRQVLFNHTTVDIHGASLNRADLDALSGALGTSDPADDLAAHDIRQKIAERITELVAQNREDQIGAVFLLRDSKDIVADDIATLFGTSRRAVYTAATRLERRLRADRTTRDLYASLTGQG